MNTKFGFASSGGASLILSFNGRTGVVVTISGDYNSNQVTEATNLYFTTARERAAFSNGNNITFTAGSIAVNDPLLVNTIQKAAGGTGGQISINNNIFNDLSSRSSINWDARRFFSTVINSIFWGTKELADTGGNITVRWSRRSLDGTIIGVVKSVVDWSTVGVIKIGSETTADFKLNVVGNKKVYKAGSNATAGTSNLSSGTVSVATTAYDGGVNDYVHVSNTAKSGTAGALSVTPLSAGNFRIDSKSASDNSKIFWEIIRVI